MWNDALLNELKYRDGSIAEIEAIPDTIKNKYKEVFEVDMRWLVRAAAYRGKWIDQSQSLNIFFRGSDGKDLSEVYFYAWKMGLKTTYYLRSLAATQVEKSTVSTQQYGSTHQRGAKSAPTAMGTISEKNTAPEKVAAPAATQPSLLTNSPATAAVARGEIKLHRAPEVTCEACE